MQTETKPNFKSKSSQDTTLKFVTKTHDQLQ